MPILSQRRFLKGLNAATPAFEQPPNTVPRVSNLLWTKRGGLSSVGLGGVTLSKFDSTLSQPAPIRVLDIALYQPNTGPARYAAVIKDPTVQLPRPTVVTITDSPSGSFVDGNYEWAVTAVDGAGGETIPLTSTPPFHITGGNKAVVDWDDVSGAAGYRVYRAGGILVANIATIYFFHEVPNDPGYVIITLTAPCPFGVGGLVTFAGLAGFTPLNGQTAQIISVNPLGDPNQFSFQFTWNGGNFYGPSGEMGTVTGGTLGGFGLVGTPTASVFDDTGAAPDASQSPPVTNTTAGSRLLEVPLPTYSRVNTLKVLPATVEALTNLENLGQVPTAPIAPTPTGLSAATPAGGVVGCICELPKLLQFNDKLIAILGNGYPLQVSDGTPGGTLPVSNSFVPSYPSWVASSPYAAKTVIKWDLFGTDTIFRVQQGGNSGATVPPFSSAPTLGQTVTDGQIIWVNEGPVGASGVAPPGAAHGIIYAGSLWIYNTAPKTNADRTAGPSCLQMSDLNNPNSWNPLNVAFIGKDDGTEGTGLASFTIAESGITPTGSLVAFKDFSTFQIIGVFGAPDFAIFQAQTDMGNIAPRSIQFLPGFGIARLAHLGVAIFDGVRDRLISAEIYPYIFGGESDITPACYRRLYHCHGAQSVMPPMYLLAIPIGEDDPVTGEPPLTRILCYDLVLKAWTIVDLPFGIGCLRQIRISHQGSQPITIAGGWDDGSIRRLFGGDEGWQDSPSEGTTSPVAWNVRTPEVFSKASADRIYTRALYVKGATRPTTIRAQLTMDSSIRPLLSMKVIAQSGVEFEAFIQTHQLGKNTHADISGTGPVELHTFDWDAEPQPAAPPVLA